MKKQVITTDDIKRELVKKINQARPLYIFVTFFTAISIIVYVFALMNPRIVQPLWMFICLFIILLFIVFLLNYYYINLYRAKKGKFTVLDEKLCRKNKEERHFRIYAPLYVSRFIKENALYFRSGRVAVEEDVFKYSEVDDKFYVVLLSSKKAPFLAYNKKYFEINLD